MSTRLTRREFVAVAAAGVALPACVQADDSASVKILVKPYIQPGNGSALEKADVKVLCWLTDQKPGDFVVEYEVPGNRKQSVTPERIALNFEKAPEPKKAEPEKPKDSADAPSENTRPLVEKEQHYFKYVARLNDLPFDAEVRYRVKMGDAVIREAAFRTRATADKPVRVAMVGDLVNGKEHQNAIAYRIGEEKPDFLVALGDLVYPGGASATT